MEVVCLILGPMLASQPCLYAFWVLTSLHLLSLLLKMFFIILVLIIFFLNCGNMFCRSLFIIKSHAIINALKFVH